MHEREFDRLAESVRRNDPLAKARFEKLVRPLVRVIVERKLRRECDRDSSPPPEASFQELVDTGTHILYEALLSSILRSAGAETIGGAPTATRLFDQLL